MRVFDNTVKHKLQTGKKVVGAWAQIASPITAEILAEAGFDVVMIDLEHGPGDIFTLVAQIQALKGNPALPFVRAPWNDFVAIKRILDAGVYGVLVPYVNTRGRGGGGGARVQVSTRRHPRHRGQPACGRLRPKQHGVSQARQRRGAGDDRGGDARSGCQPR